MYNKLVSISGLPQDIKVVMKARNKAYELFKEIKD
jgi:hypothetical protein